MGLVTFEECIRLYGEVRRERSVKGPVFTISNIRRLVPRRIGTTRNLVRPYPRRTIDEDLDTRRLGVIKAGFKGCLLYTSPSPRDRQKSRMPSSA